MAFLGQDGFTWAIGVVEDRFDPEKVGRVRVRWLGYHTEDKAKILTKDLPWSQVMQSVGGNSMAGVGDAPVNIVEGTWVVGFFRDPGTFQDSVVIGTMPGMNTTTAINGASIGGKWPSYRGNYVEFNQDENRPETPIVEGDSRINSDYEFGFFDPTVDESKVPHPPSELTYGSAVGYATVPSDYIEFDYTQTTKLPRVLNWSPEIIQDLESTIASPLYGSVDAQKQKIIGTSEVTSEASAPETSRITPSDLLHMMFKTTRRITADERQVTSWVKLGLFKWPDSITYTREFGGVDNEPVKPGGEGLTVNQLKSEDKTGSVVSTGYLEDDIWRNAETDLPSYPWTRDLPRYNMRFNNTETGQFGQEGEWYRIPHPRVKFVKKKNLTPTQYVQAKALYDSGHYGSGVYEMDDDRYKPVGRKDIEWADVDADNLVIIQTPDTNRLAMGGIPITSVSLGSTTKITTSSDFWTGFETETGANAKPELSQGDIIMLAGLRGTQELNGRVFFIKNITDNKTSYTIELGCKDGTAWSGPGTIAWSGDSYTITGEDVDSSNFSPYINGGVLIIDPHPVLQFKSDIRERQINIGSPDPETGLNAKFWNQPTSDFNAQYPYNHVHETESGHIKEYDDTPGAERIHEYHRAGTFYEIDHAGNKVDYVKGDRYDISLNDDYVYVKGRVIHTYDDEVLIRCNDRLDLSSKWKMQIWSGGDLDIHSKRNINMKSDGDINLQADGHINLQGTTLTADQAKYKAGTKGVGEMSKIKMKAGHLYAEMIGNEAKKDIAGIALQSNLSPIQIKTINEGGSIYITSAEDMEMFAQKNLYRSAYEGFIDDYAGTNIKIRAYTEDISIYAEDTTDGHVRIKAGNDLFLESLDDMQIKSGGSLYATTTGGSVNLKASSAMYAEAGGGAMNIKASGSILNTGSQIHLNNTAAGSASSATESSALSAVISNISETFTMLVTDLSNPDPADPPLISTDSHGLALNANNLEYGSGGENIRNLQDVITSTSSGIFVHAGKYPTDIGAHTATGTRTTTTAGDWSGYVDGPLSDFYVLGPQSLSDSRPEPKT